jgi:hypothetical protein
MRCILRTKPSFPRALLLKARGTLGEGGNPVLGPSFPLYIVIPAQAGIQSWPSSCHVVDALASS